MEALEREMMKRGFRFQSNAHLIGSARLIFQVRDTLMGSIQIIRQSWKFSSVMTHFGSIGSFTKSEVICNQNVDFNLQKLNVAYTWHGDGTWEGGGIEKYFA